MAQFSTSLVPRDQTQCTEMANRANTQMAYCSHLPLAIRRGSAVLLEHYVCHMLLIHGYSFLLRLLSGKSRPLNERRLRRGVVVQHLGALELLHSLQRKDHHACLAVPEQAYPDLLAGMICHAGFPAECAAVADAHQELAPAHRLRVRPSSEEYLRVCGALFLPV